MKKVIGWILFYLGIGIIQWGIVASTIGIGSGGGLSWASIPAILVILGCFTGWFFLAFLPGRREKKERDAMNEAYLQRAKSREEYQNAKR